MSPWWRDSAERVASAFLLALASTLLLAGADVLSLSTWHAAAVAGVTAALVAVKSLVAARIGGTVSPASLAPGKPTLAKNVHVGITSEGRLKITHEDARQIARSINREVKRLGPAQGDRVVQKIMSDRNRVTKSPAYRLSLLPESSGRKHGAIPSPRDDRDWPAKLPATIPSHVDNGKGITFGMLLNDRIGDCYPAALLHALQVLNPGYQPTDADALHVYEQVTGYQPGNPATDQGTYGRQLFDWARANGAITSYAAVPPDRDSVRAAIAAHKVVLCEWALPTGAETEGVNWKMPRSGKVAGSWGYHATCEVGYTKTHDDNVTWGAEGKVTEAFQQAYLQAAWVVTV